MGRSTGVLMCPHPGINAEKRPACAADDEQMNPVRRFHDWDATVRLALVPFRKIAIVDLAVTVTS